jgi:superfamily II DNA/RNA helicase/ferredoxin
MLRAWNIAHNNAINNYKLHYTGTVTSLTHSSMYPAVSAFPHSVVAIQPLRSIGYRGIHHTSSLHGRRDKSELHRYRGPSALDAHVQPQGQSRSDAARIWSVRQAQTRKQRRAAFAQNRQESLEAHKKTDETNADVPEGNSAQSKQSNQSVYLHPQHRTPRQPHRSDLSHPSSDFFKPIACPVPSENVVHNGESMTAVSPSEEKSFKDLGVASHVHSRLAGTFDIFTPTPIQCASIPFLMHAPHFTERDTSDPQDQHPLTVARRQRLRRAPLPRDLIIQDMTGAGKTLSYALPLLSLVDNFKAKALQGIVIAPTRELAVQIWRVLRRLNDIRNAGARRKAHPLTLRLAVGSVTESYAAQVRADPCHIIIGTPRTIEQLVCGVRATKQQQPRDGKKLPPILVRPAVNLRQLRLLVLDEVDHLFLPSTCAPVERVLQTLTSTASHGSMHRLARMVLVSAALSERVREIAGKWLHRPVTATAAGLLDGWILPENMLRDKFFLRKQNQLNGEGVQTAASENTTDNSAVNTATDAVTKSESTDQNEEEEDDRAIDTDADQLSASSEEILPRPTLAERLRARGIDLDKLDPDTRDAYEEADEIGDEDEESMEEMYALQEAREEAVATKAAAMAESGQTPKEPDAALIGGGQVVRADTFVLPGSAAAREAAVAAAAAATAAAEAQGKAVVASTPVSAGVLEEERLMPLLANYPAAEGLSPFGAPASLSAASAAHAEPEDVSSVMDAPLPSAANATGPVVRFLPPTLRHFSVHLAPSVKPLQHKGSTEEDRGKALESWSKLLTQLHAALKPRVAVVFFNRANDAIELAPLLRSRHMRVSLLLAGGGLRAEDRLHTIESALHGTVDFVLATDLAARGLDIRGLSHVINFDLPSTALDYVHRAGRVERLGGKKGCTVINLIRDHREEGWDAAADIAARNFAEQIAQDPTHITFPLPKRKGTFAGKQVNQMRTFAAQLHLDVPSVILQKGELVPLKDVPRIPRIKTPPTPKKLRNDAEEISTNTIGHIISTTTLTSASSNVNAETARSYTTYARRLFGGKFPLYTATPSPILSRYDGRSFHSNSSRPLLHNSTAIPGGASVNVIFITPDGERVPVTGIEGENLLALAHQNDVELEGACEASLACSTCHVILPDSYYSKLDPPVDEENDMLDLAFGLTDTSRLGCQVKLTKELEGMEIQLPAATRNMAVDGHKPKPH